MATDERASQLKEFSVELFFLEIWVVLAEQIIQKHYFINTCICQELFALELEENKKLNPFLWSDRANSRPQLHKGTEQSPAPGKASLSAEGFGTQLVGFLSPQALQ